jgi:hypothetical protein
VTLGGRYEVLKVLREVVQEGSAAISLKFIIVGFLSIGVEIALWWQSHKFVNDCALHRRGLKGLL